MVQKRKKSAVAAMLLSAFLSFCSCTSGGGGESTTLPVTNGESSVSAEISLPEASAEAVSPGNGEIELPIDRF